MTLDPAFVSAIGELHEADQALTSRRQQVVKQVKARLACDTELKFDFKINEFMCQCYWSLKLPLEDLVDCFGRERDQILEIVKGNTAYVDCLSCSATVFFDASTIEERNRVEKLLVYCEVCSARIRQKIMEDSKKKEAIEQEKVLRHQARLVDLRSMPYQEYLLTPEWQEKRKVALENDGHACRLCGAKEQLQVHHRTYARRGDEAPDDLVTLCADCHQAFHDNRALAAS